MKAWSTARKRTAATSAIVAWLVVAGSIVVPRLAANASDGYKPTPGPCPNRNTAVKSETNPWGVTPSKSPTADDKPGPTDYDKPGVVHPGVVAESLEKAQTIRCVHVGGGDIYEKANPGRGNFTLTRFYPGVLQVHQGDIVEFRPAPGWAGATHTPGAFRDGSGRGKRDPLTPVFPLVRSDEVPGTIAFHQAIATGSGLREGRLIDNEGCGLKSGSRTHGIPPQRPCEISSVPDDAHFDLNEAFTNVGRPQPFWVEIDLPPGTYTYHCTYHSWMTGAIEVVADDVEVPSHEEVEKQALEMAKADVAEAEALQLELGKPRWRQDGDERIWRVTTGATTDSGHATIISYLPASLRVRPGDRVEFVGGRPDAPTLVGRTGEAQTVTFPGEAVGGFYLDGCTYEHCDGSVWFEEHGAPELADNHPYERLHHQAVPHGLTLPVFPWACDYDEWNGGSPGVPKTWVPRAGCPLGPLAQRGKFEFLFSELAARSQRAPNDEVTRATTLHNSGWLAPSAYSWPTRPTDDPTWKEDPTWPTTFPARFPEAGTFTYGCLLHPDVMTGAVTVVAP